MKNLIIVIGLPILLFAFSVNLPATSSLKNPVSNDTINIWCSPALMDLTALWVNEYAKAFPEAKLNLIVVQQDSWSQNDNASASLGFLNRNEIPASWNKSIWNMVLGRDILVAVMNSDNPFSVEINENGITPEKLALVLSNNSEQNWGTILNNEQGLSSKCNFIVDKKVINELATFLNIDSEQIDINESDDIESLFEAISQDKYAIGFSRLTDITNPKFKKINEAISLIPIDINSNGRVDYFENIYDNPSDLNRGVWIGKYPKNLYSSILAVASSRPVNEKELAFLEWILSDGQQYLYTEGYSELVFSERQSKLQNLDHSKTLVLADQHNPPLSSGILFIIAVFIVVIGIVFLFIRTIRQGKSENEMAIEENPLVFNEQLISAPAGLFFDKSHTWVFMEKNGLVRIGIDDFLHHVTGKITKIKMRNPGDRLSKGKPFLSLIQQGKQLEIHSPVSGRIIEINGSLLTDSSIYNSDPYAGGWIYTVESDNWLKEMKLLLMGKAYRAWIQSEFSRLKDFMSFSNAKDATGEQQFVMQDGGEIQEGLLQDFGPKVWEEFQREFIDQRSKNGIFK